jgi:uncharacterized membrane protein (DUF2068 family)
MRRPKRVPPKKSRRTLGIFLIAVYSALGALSALPVGLAATVATAAPEATLDVAIGALLMTSLGLLLLISCYGLWTLRSWGRKFSWWLYFLAIPLGATFLFPILPGQVVDAGNTVANLVTMAIDVVILLYLRKTAVASLFESAPKDPAPLTAQPASAELSPS